MARIARQLTDLVGNTPLLEFSNFNASKGLKAQVIGKLEYFNPAGSVKDRIALAMIEDAEAKGLLRPGATIIEPTSGNTGVGLAFVSASKGYKLILTMPDTMSAERRNLLKALGAQLVLTPGAEGMKGAIAKAEELRDATPGSIILQQFENPANPAMHIRTTAEEIWRDTDGKVDLFVAGVGTGGTVSGVGAGLKAHNPNVQIVAVEPSDSPVLSGGKPGPHKIQGIGAGFIPKTYNGEVVDKILQVTNDDAIRTSRELAGKAVPLLRSEAPIVGTGIERQLVRDSRTQIAAEGDGVIDFVDATTIRILYDRTEDEEFVSFEPALKEYRIPKFRKTNQNMTIDLRPICNKGDRVTKGQILTEGYSTENGELALGKNLLVAYMPWKGYNYEDAIVLNERVVREDLLTSVHVEEYSLEVRETKRGMEELTSDIPNVSEEATKDLDENGIVRVGARIQPGDILIGKITPKGESDPSPEEKLLRAIFGDKAGDVKDASLKASPSLKGVIIDKKLFSRVIKNRSSKLADKALLPKIDDEFESKVADLKRILVKKLMALTEGKVSQGVKDYLGAEVIAKGSKFSASDFDSLDFTAIQLSDWTNDDHANGMIRDLVMNFIKKYKELDAELKRKKFAITIGDELPAGIIQMAKVYIAKKRKIGVGDKMAGRHGNKGIVSRVVRQEDMPFLADGTPVDIVLNPLGVPSRMNIGQIFEAVLGRAGKNLGVKFATPIFDGATLDDLNEWTDKAGLPRYGKTKLYDGGTGEPFDQHATVGVTYMLKLGHMVEDKMHARSIGPYSLITQQPLGGKAQFGGQRFGEMEVWALEAFGAAHILQEILTIKSDDVVGRSKAYEAIVKGEPMPQPGIPESLNVLLHELRGLGLSINLE